MNIPMSDEEKLAIYHELLHVPTRDDFPKPNITVREAMAISGMTRGAAYLKLETLVRDGTMRKADQVNLDGHSTSIYWAASLEEE